MLQGFSTVNPAAVQPAPASPLWVALEALVRVAYGLVWIYAAVLKLQDPQLFLDDIRSFRILGDPWAAMLAVGLPWLELACGVAVVVGRRLYGGSLVILGGALLVFLVAIVASWIRGLDISCGCFGAADDRSSYPWLVVRDLVMLAANALLLWRHVRIRGAAPGLGGADPGDAAATPAHG